MELQSTQTSRPLNLHIPCSICGSSDAATEYDDGHTYCFSCQSYTPSSRQESFQEKSDQYTYEYLSRWKIDAGTFRTFGVLTKIDAAGNPVSMGFRYPSNDYQVRRLDKKEFYWTKYTSKHGLFGRDLFPEGSHKYVVVTEGGKDALSAWQMLHIPCVSVVSASTAHADCTVDRSYLNSYERIYLCFDADAPGREAVQRVAKLFEPDKVWQVKLIQKDANDYLSAGLEEEFKNIFWNSKRYLPDCIISTQEEFDVVLSEEPKYGVAYPFPTVTAKTKGIRLGESVLITAQEGVGKTELMHAIEYSLLTNTDSNIGAIFLEEPPRRNLQALAGIHLRAPVHLPDSGYSTDEVRRAIREILKRDERLFVYRYFGNDNPEVLLDTIRLLVAGRQCNYILLDHITMLSSGSQTEDERRKLDYLSTKLEMMVKELNYGLIVVSHVNDNGQTRGSRYISKIADVRIDADRNVTSNTDMERRTIRLSISKNRPAWETGFAGSYVFDPLTQSYSEGTNDLESEPGLRSHENNQGEVRYNPSFENREIRLSG